MLDENTKNSVRGKLGEMQGEVKLIFLKKEENCQYCGDIEQLYSELVELSNGKLSVEKNQLNEKGEEYNVETGPVTIVEGKEKRFVRFFGIPAGHEFGAFIQTIVDVSKGKPEISSDLEEKVKSIDFPVHFKVFVSPTCPYCPAAMKVANDFALINENVKADVYEVNEFRELAAKYNVSGVPKTVINETEELIGAYPPDVTLQKILSLKK